MALIQSNIEYNHVIMSAQSRRKTKDDGQSRRIGDHNDDKLTGNDLDLVNAYQNMLEEKLAEEEAEADREATAIQDNLDSFHELISNARKLNRENNRLKDEMSQNRYEKSTYQENIGIRRKIREITRNGKRAINDNDEVEMDTAFESIEALTEKLTHKNNDLLKQINNIKDSRENDNSKETQKINRDQELKIHKSEQSDILQLGKNLTNSGVTNKEQSSSIMSRIRGIGKRHSEAIYKATERYRDEKGYSDTDKALDGRHQKIGERAPGGR